MTTFAEPGALVLMKETHHDATSRSGAVVRLEFEGADPQARLLGRERLPGERHYFLGNEPSRWRRFVPGFAQVAYVGLYPGVDLVLRETAGCLEYDLMLEPWADLDDVVVRCEGIDSLALEEDGTLRLDTAAGPLRQPQPTTWWVAASGDREPVSCRYRLLGEGRYGFAVDGPQVARPLVIDPGLEWSTHFGSPSGGPFVEAMVLGPSGEATFTGDTLSAGLPVTAGAYDISFNPGGALPRDVYVCQLTPAGDDLVFCTYLGCASVEFSTCIARTPTGDTVIGGWTLSQGFPVTPGAFDTVPEFPFGDAFVTCLSADGSELVFSTFLGGNGFGTDSVRDVLVEVDGSILVMGRALTSDFPTTPGAYDTTLTGGEDVFISRLDATGATLMASTLLGNDGNPVGREMAVTNSGNIVVVGTSPGIDFPITPGAYVSPKPGFFVTCLKADLSDLVFSASVGGSSVDLVRAVAIDPLGNIVFGGETASADYPITPGAFQSIPSGSFGSTSDGFVSCLDPTGSTLVYSTYLVGAGTDIVEALAVDSAGSIIAVGATGSPDFPTTTGAFDTQLNNGPAPTTFADLFVTKLSPDGKTLHYSTFLGGGGSDGDPADSGMSLALTPSGSVVVATGSRSVDYPTTPGAFEPTLQGPIDVVVTRLDLLPTGVGRYGVSTPGCGGPLAISVTGFPGLGSSKFAVTCTSAPPSSTQGWLLIGTESLAAPVSAAGVALWVDPLALVLPVPVKSDAVGYCEQPLRVPLDPTLLGAEYFFQFAWPTSCQPSGWSASAALTVTVQP